MRFAGQSQDVGKNFDSCFLQICTSTWFSIGAFCVSGEQERKVKKNFGNFNVGQQHVFVFFVVFFCDCVCLCFCHLDNIIVGEEDVAESDVSVKDSLLGQVPQSSRHLNFYMMMVVIMMIMMMMLMLMMIQVPQSSRHLLHDDDNDDDAGGADLETPALCHQKEIRDISS